MNSKKSRLRINIQGIPRGLSVQIDDFTRSSSVKQGMRFIAIRRNLIPRNAINPQLSLIFKDCTISWQEYPDGRWRVISPDE